MAQFILEPGDLCKFVDDDNKVHYAIIISETKLRDLYQTGGYPYIGCCQLDADEAYIDPTLRRDMSLNYVIVLYKEQKAWIYYNQLEKV